MTVALEHRHALRARVVDARRAADDLAHAALDDLLLGDEVALLVAPAVAYAHVGARFLDRLNHAVGVGERERDRFLDQHRLAKLDGLEHRREVLAFAGRNDDGIHFGTRDDFGVVAGMKLRADFAGEIARLCRSPGQRPRCIAPPDVPRRAAPAACRCGPSRRWRGPILCVRWCAPRVRELSNARPAPIVAGATTRSARIRCARVQWKSEANHELKIAHRRKCNVRPQQTISRSGAGRLRCRLDRCGRGTSLARQAHPDDRTVCRGRRD